MSVFDALGGAAFSVAESSLFAVARTLEAAHTGVRALAGEPRPAPLTRPPLEGPQEMDRATAEFGNRLLRLLRYARVDDRGMGGVVEALGEAARESFGFILGAHPRQLATLPFELSLSLGTLWTQESLRVLYGLRMMRLGAPAFIVEIAENFLDGPVYLGLRYGEQLERLKNRVAHAPQDSRAWLELGRYLMKCGMHWKAIEALDKAASFADVRSAALYQRSIANYRVARYQDAVADAVASLGIDPDQPRAQFWLWLAAGKLGGYPASVPQPLRVEMQSGRHETELRFESVASEIGLDKTGDGRGIAVFDYDVDGRLDVLIASGGGCSLFHNDGDGTFSDVSVGSGLDSCVSGFAVSVGDYDNDGRPDVFVTRAGFLDGASVLYRNNGDGTFTDVTEKAGLSGWMSTFNASWVDYDGDGHLDLFVCSNLNGMLGRKVPDRLFHNNGDGTFTDVTERSGIQTPWPTLGSAWGDFNNDGYPDLFLSSAFGRSQLFRNNGDGTFTNVSRGAGIDEPCLGSVAFWCDYDDDGWLDLVQCLWCPHEDMLHSLRHGTGPEHGRSTRIFHNNRDGTFREIAREMGITESWGSMSGNAGDIDNDGRLDLLLGNGGPQMDRAEPAVLLQRDASGRFRNVTFTAGLPPFGKSHGANMADLFGDGRLSILLASGGFYPGEPMTTEVYRPKERLGNYVSVKLKGTASNRDAIGARLRLYAGGRVQHRLVSGGSGFGSMPFDQHFGVGASTSIEALEIDWPSRRRQRIEAVPVNTAIVITEGVDRVELLRA